RERMADLDAIIAGDDKKKESTRLLSLIRNSLYPFHREIPRECFLSLSPDTYNKDVRQKVNNYLNILQEKLADALNATWSGEKKIIDSLVDEYGGVEKLVELKKEYYNESLADLVLNRSELKKVYETSDMFIRKMEPIYQIPVSRLGRAHFFSAYKLAGNLVLGTVAFNVLVIWLMTVLLYISLQFSWLARVIAFFNSLSGNKR
ncbi:unnamed protein product, partial [marine sediment metagenome]